MLPLDIKGIMIRGISPSRHTPTRDMTLGWSKDNMVDISLVSCFKSPEENSAADNILHIRVNNVDKCRNGMPKIRQTSIYAEDDGIPIKGVERDYVLYAIMA